MMFWFGHGLSGWGWVAMSVGMLLLWMLLLTLAVLAVRAMSRAEDQPSHPDWPHHPMPGGLAPPPGGFAPMSPEQILADRFARGEIDEQEFRARLAALREAQSAPAPSGPAWPATGPTDEPGRAHRLVRR